jgi:hypothetical protein
VRQGAPRSGRAGQHSPTTLVTAETASAQMERLCLLSPCADGGVQRVGRFGPASGSVSLSESLLLLMVISSSAGVNAGDPCISLAAALQGGKQALYMRRSR